MDQLPLSPKPFAGRTGAPTRPEATVDQDLRKGAKEDDRPGPERSDRPGLDPDGWPNDPVAIGQDAIGAKVDNSQG